jgi:hypothetical protein
MFEFCFSSNHIKKSLLFFLRSHKKEPFVFHLLFFNLLLLYGVFYSFWRLLKYIGHSQEVDG